jgi:5-methylcytosine-specific restriction endonuclease McrA
MPPPGYYRRRRERLMGEDPHCHWCRKALTLCPDYRSEGFAFMPGDYPTIDHLTSRFMGPRKNGDGKTQVVVLACPRCNNARNLAETKKYIWRTRWKSASFPFPLRWLGRTLKKSRWRKKSLLMATSIHQDSAPSRRGPG